MDDWVPASPNVPRWIKENAGYNCVELIVRELRAQRDEAMALLLDAPWRELPLSWVPRVGKRR